jgi:hypothetical protein
MLRDHGVAGSRGIASQAVRVAAVLALFALYLLVPGTAAAATTSAQVTTPDIAAGEIRSGITNTPPAGTDGWCLDDRKGSAVGGNPVDLYGCNDNYSSQLWTAEADGTVRIHGMCVGVAGGSKASGSLVEIDSCNGAASEIWRQQSGGTLLNVNSGLCLGVPNGNIANDQQLWIYSCNTNQTQQWPLSAPSPATEAAAAFARLQGDYSSRTGLFDGCTAYSGNCWWWSANALSAIIDYYEQEKKLAGAAGDASFPGAQAVLNDLSASSSTITSFTSDSFYDDAGWWGLTWISAYGLTKNSSYLTLAENIFNHMTVGWDGACGGGVWQTSSHNHKNAITNALYLMLAARLYQVTGQSKYLDGGTYSNHAYGGVTAAASWITGNLLLSDNLVADLVTPSTCATDASAQKWTYNQGMTVTALLDAYGVTGTSAYLTDAENIATAVLGDTQLSVGSPAGALSDPALVDTSGILSEPCIASPAGDWPAGCNLTTGQSWLAYKGTFIRGLYCVNRLAGNAGFSTFIAANANSVYALDQNTETTNPAAADLNEFGFQWDGTFTAARWGSASQASALEAMNASIGVSYQIC